jgi:hypothetical protein
VHNSSDIVVGEARLAFLQGVEQLIAALAQLRWHRRHAKRFIVALLVGDRDELAAA